MNSHGNSGNVYVSLKFLIFTAQVEEVSEGDFFVFEGYRVL